MSAQEIIQFYDHFADTYDEVVLKEKDYIAFEKIPGWILERLHDRLKRPAHILDLGCGTGLGSKPFMGKHQVTGVDISPKMVEVAAKLPFHTLLCQSLEDPLPFTEREFDAAQLLGVMEFIQDPTRLFLNIHHILKKNGLFALTVPKKLDSRLEKELGIQTYCLEEIEKLFLTSGFLSLKKEEFQGFQYLGKTVHYCGYLLSTF